MALPEADDEVLLLINPACSKCRAARGLLEERGAAFRERRYLEDPLSAEELRELGARLGLPARDWVRSGEEAYAAAALGDDPEEDALIGAIAAAPVLMQRPIVVRGRRARIGRPPEDVLELFGEDE